MKKWMTYFAMLTLLATVTDWGLTQEEKQILGGGIKVLDIMEDITKGIGIDNKVRLYQLYIGEGKLIAKGEAESFEDVNRFKEAITKIPSFKEALLTDINTKPGGGAAFSLSVKMSDNTIK